MTMEKRRTKRVEVTAVNDKRLLLTVKISRGAFRIFQSLTELSSLFDPSFTCLSISFRNKVWSWENRPSLTIDRSIVSGRLVAKENVTIAEMRMRRWNHTMKTAKIRPPRKFYTYLHKGAMSNSKLQECRGTCSVEKCLGYHWSAVRTESKSDVCQLQVCL